MNHSTVSCFTESGAVAEYQRVVLGYGTFAGLGCWRKLPQDIKEAHAAHARAVSSLIHKGGAASQRHRGGREMDHRRTSGRSNRMSTNATAVRHSDRLSRTHRQGGASRSVRSRSHTKRRRTVPSKTELVLSLRSLERRLSRK